MNAFSDAIDALFTDANISRSVDYTSLSGGVLSGVRVLLPELDDGDEGFSAAAHGVTVLSNPNAVRYRVRRSEIAHPVQGDLIDDGGEVWRVNADPLPDRRRYSWFLEVEPVP